MFLAFSFFLIDMLLGFNLRESEGCRALSIFFEEKEWKKNRLLLSSTIHFTCTCPLATLIYLDGSLEFLGHSLYILFSLGHTHPTLQPEAQINILFADPNSLEFAGSNLILSYQMTKILLRLMERPNRRIKIGGLRSLRREWFVLYKLYINGVVDIKLSTTNLVSMWYVFFFHISLIFSR